MLSWFPRLMSDHPEGTFLVTLLGSCAIGAILVLSVYRWAERTRRYATWSRLARWAYLGVKWTLILSGAFAAVGLAAQEIHRGVPALGTGLTVALIGGTIKGVSQAWATGWRPRFPFPTH